MIIGGALAIIAFPFTMIWGVSIQTVFIVLGCSLATIGAGCLLIVIFWPLTKYSAIGSMKLLKMAFGK
jgi:hypothetical protein